VNGAGAAQARAASEFRSGHLQLLADGPEQRGVTRRIDGLTLSVDIQSSHLLLPLPVYEAVYDGISRGLGGWSPTGSAPVGAQHDRLAVERQSKLESFEENNFSNRWVVHCGSGAVVNPLRGMRALRRIVDPLCNDGGFTLLGRSRYNPARQ
jgi:hypothetical protein